MSEHMKLYEVFIRFSSRPGSQACVACHARRSRPGAGVRAATFYYPRSEGVDLGGQLLGLFVPSQGRL